MNSINNDEKPSLLTVGIEYQRSRDKIENSPVLNEFIKAKAELKEAYANLMSNLPKPSSAGDQLSIKKIEKFVRENPNPEVLSEFTAKAQKLKRISKKMKDESVYQDYRIVRQKFKREALSFLSQASINCKDPSSFESLKELLTVLEPNLDTKTIDQIREFQLRNS